MTAQIVSARSFVTYHVGMLLHRVAALTMRLLVSVFLLGGALAHEALQPPPLDELDDLLDQSVGRAFSMWNYWKYDHIAICIQVVDGTLNDARYAREQLRAATSAFVGPHKVHGTKFKFPPLIDLGCPAGPSRYGPRSAYQVMSGFFMRVDYMLYEATGCCQYGSLIHHRYLHMPREGRRVAADPGDPLPAPSPYALHLYIVNSRRQEPADQSPDWPTLSDFSEEYWTDSPYSHVSVIMTSGRYLTLEQFADMVALERMLGSEFRLERRVTLPPQPGSERAVPAEAPKPQPSSP